MIVRIITILIVINLLGCRVESNSRNNNLIMQKEQKGEQDKRAFVIVAVKDRVTATRCELNGVNCVNRLDLGTLVITKFSDGLSAQVLTGFYSAPSAKAVYVDAKVFENADKTLSFEFSKNNGCNFQINTEQTLESLWESKKTIGKVSISKCRNNYPTGDFIVVMFK